MPVHSYRFLVASDDIYFPNTAQQTISFSDPESIKILREIYHSTSRTTLTNKELLIVYRKENEEVDLFEEEIIDEQLDKKGAEQNKSGTADASKSKTLENEKLTVDPKIENDFSPRIVDIDELSKYASLIRVQSYRAKTRPDKSDWQTVILDFTVLEKVQVVDLITDPNNVKADQISIKSTREIIKNREIHVSLINDLLEFGRKTKNFKMPGELLLVVDKFQNSNTEVEKNEFIKGVTNTLSSSVSLSYQQKYHLFALNSYASKIKKLYEHVHTFNEQIRLEDEINVILKSNLDKQQTEFILKEKIKAIRKKLGEDSRYEDEIEELLHSEIGKLIFPKEVAKTIKREANRLKSMMATSPESNITKNYLDLLVALP